MTRKRVNINARIPSRLTSHRIVDVRMECSGDDCPCKYRRSVHAPVLMVFDGELGKYRQGHQRCTAIWAEGSRTNHEPGLMCGEPATHQVGDVQLCEHHYRRIRDWMNERDQLDVREAVAKTIAIRAGEMGIAERAAAIQRQIDQETARRQAELEEENARLRSRLTKEENARQIELDRERIRAEEAARAEISRVYFVRRESDGLIKIGTSRDLPRRLVAIKRKCGPLQLIATVAGAHKEETALHRQFAELRIEGEWFRPELPLLKHLHALIKEYPLKPAPDLPPIMAVQEIEGAIRTAERERRRLARQQASAGEAA